MSDSDSIGRSRWWVFRRPLLKDWLFLVGVALGLAAIVRTIVQADQLGALTIVLNVLFAVPAGVLFAGILGGIIREYRRGKSTAAHI